ncbi:MAG TPA: hypothetical protein DEH78_26420 [Solibacterales bacterium]|nr:hypothetical protein [Bryobacterales bacterium]
MRRFLSQRIPDFRRVLVIESGSRYLLEDLLPGLYAHHPDVPVDLFTCYPGLPRTFRADRGLVFRASDYQGRPARRRLYAELSARQYNILGLICSGEPIMTKWKWMVAARIPAKVFVLNENGDYFWLDRGNWRTVRHFVLFRAGLSGAGAVRTLGRLALFPFTLLYLLLFAAIVHLKRKVHA